MSNLRNVYQTEDGIDELVNMCSECKVFDFITINGDMVLRNYAIGKLKRLGFTKGNIRAILEFAMRLPVNDEKTERQRVAEEYFGESAYTDVE